MNAEYRLILDSHESRPEDSSKMFDSPILAIETKYFITTGRNSLRVRRIPDDPQVILDYFRYTNPRFKIVLTKVSPPFVDDKIDSYSERVKSIMEEENKEGSLYVGWEIAYSYSREKEPHQVVRMERRTTKIVQCCIAQYGCTTNHYDTTSCCNVRSRSSPCYCTTDALESYISFPEYMIPRIKDSFITLCGGIHFGYNSYYPNRYKDLFDNFLGLTQPVDGSKNRPDFITDVSLPPTQPISLSTDCTAEQEIETNKNIIHLTSVITDLSVRNNELLERLTLFEEEKEKVIASITEELETTKKRKQYHKAKSRKRQEKIENLLIEVEKQKRKLQKWEKWHSSVLNDD